MICYPGTDIDFIKGRLDIVHGSKGVIIYVGGGNSIRNMEGKFKRSEILLEI